MITSVMPAIFCSSGYITPDSLTATALPLNKTSVPTAYFIKPTENPSSEVSISETNIPNIEMPTQTQDESSSEAETPTPTATLGPISADGVPEIYIAQSGDTIKVLSSHFGVNAFEIQSAEEIPETGFLSPGQILMIPDRLALTSSDVQIIPDSDVVYSPSASNFDVLNYVNSFGGMLSSIEEFVVNLGVGTGPEIIEFVARNNSLNPRILLGLLQYQSNWVYGQPNNFSQTDFPYGYINSYEKGFHKQLVFTIEQLSIGYYGWREGTLNHLSFSDGTSIRLAPNLNAGSVAILYFFSQILEYEEWLLAVDPDQGFPHFFNTMFGDSWVRASQVEPLIPSKLTQPFLILPFYRGQSWGFTSGPHGAWRPYGSLAAIDFAPGAIEEGCVQSESWVIANASGTITRIGEGLIVIDLDGDGDENTGWNIMFLHLDNTDHLILDQWVEVGDFIGNPSCKGGYSSGPHIHIARKYNGEWISAGGPIPFNLGGWVVEAADVPYNGYLSRGDVRIELCDCVTEYLTIERTDEDP